VGYGGEAHLTHIFSAVETKEAKLAEKQITFRK